MLSEKLAKACNLVMLWGGRAYIVSHVSLDAAWSGWFQRCTLPQPVSFGTVVTISEAQVPSHHISRDPPERGFYKLEVRTIRVCLLAVAMTKLNLTHWGVATECRAEYCFHPCLHLLQR